jgi:hypothetical protein
MGVLGVLDLASVPGEADPTEDGTSGPTSDPSSSPATIAVPTSVETATDDAHVVSYVIDGADVRRVRATCSCGWGSPWSSDMVSHPFLGTEPGRRAVLDAVLHQREMGARCEGIEPRLALGRLP